MTSVFILWINFCSILVHPLYFSVINMDVDATEKRIAMSIRIFTEDLETILHNKYNIEGWIGTPHEHRESRRLLREYVNERFTAEVNHSEKIGLTVDSMVIVEDVMWFYMKGAARQTIRYMKIDNRLLTDFFEKQTNLVIINTGREEKGYRLDRKKHKIELSL